MGQELFWHGTYGVEGHGGVHLSPFRLVLEEGYISEAHVCVALTLNYSASDSFYIDRNSYYCYH